jgi:mono/diheme cytochrome c family protein
MKPIFLLVVSLLAGASVHAEPADPINGKKLFEESRCMGCHTADSFTKPDRKVKNLAALESQVRRCDANLSTNWFDDQIMDVVTFLNQSYYKFPPPNASNGNKDPANKTE